jgi:hypothetical protein
MLLQAPFGRSGVETVTRERRDRGPDVPPERLQVRILEDRIGQEDFARLEAGDLGRQARCVRLGERETAGRDVDGGEPVGPGRVGGAPAGDGEEEIGPARIEQAILGDGAGRDEPHHIAADDGFRAALPRLGRIFRLLADRHPVAERDEALEIVVGALDRHAAHRDILPEMLAALGQDDAERPARDFRIREEQLIEIAHPVEQEAVRMGGLDLDILHHHRRGALVLGRSRRGGRVRFEGFGRLKGRARGRHRAGPYQRRAAVSSASHRPAKRRVDKS